MPAWVDSAFDDYARRFPSRPAVSLTCVATANRKPGASIAACQRQEAQKIQQQIKKGSLTIALDEHGSAWSTRAWAEQYRQWLQHHPQVNFVIGGPDGLAQDLIQSADKTVALGPMTMPHGLVRVVLIEQLYRVWSLVEGHPYHRN